MSEIINGLKMGIKNGIKALSKEIGVLKKYQYSQI
jgi:hypothetical protein